MTRWLECQIAFAVIPHLNARIRGTKHSAHCLVISSLRLTINDHTEASDTEKKTCASPPNELPSKPDVAWTSSFFLGPLFSWSEDEHFSCSMVLHLICSNAKHVPTEPASNTQTSKKARTHNPNHNSTLCPTNIWRWYFDTTLGKCVFVCAMYWRCDHNICHIRPGLITH